MSSDSSDDDMPLARTNGHRKLSHLSCFAPACFFVPVLLLSHACPIKFTPSYAPSELGRAILFDLPHILILLTPDLILVSASTISKAEDKAMDSRAKPLPAPVSIRNGPVVDSSPHMNGNGKRKSRSSTNRMNYKDESDSEDGRLVRVY